MKNPLYIGISGVAGSGKDTLYSLIRQRFPNQRVHRYALADCLREEAQAVCLQSTGVDPTDCTRQDKEKIRDILVQYATQKRLETRGSYWIQKLSKKINTEKPTGVICITDIRYSDYKEDEVYWLKKKLGGKLIHVSLYKEGVGFGREYKPPANEEEARNDPKLKAAADFLVQWKLAKGKTREDINSELYADHMLGPLGGWLQGLITQGKVEKV